MISFEQSAPGFHEIGSCLDPQVSLRKLRRIDPPTPCTGDSNSVYRGFPVPSSVLNFFYEESLTPHHTPSLEDRPFSVFGECLFLRASTQIYQSWYEIRCLASHVLYVLLEQGCKTFLTEVKFGACRSIRWHHLLQIQSLWTQEFSWWFCSSPSHICLS
jgi:hypothetical protein